LLLGISISRCYTLGNINYIQPSISGSIIRQRYKSFYRTDKWLIGIEFDLAYYIKSSSGLIIALIPGVAVVDNDTTIGINIGLIIPFN